MLPHYVTINECLSKLAPKELEKIRKKMIYNIIRKIDKDGKKWQEFQWISGMRIRGKTAHEFAETGRKRWLIENE